MFIRRSKCLKISYFGESVDHELKYLGTTPRKTILENNRFIPLDQINTSDECVNRLYTIMSDIISKDLVAFTLLQKVYGTSEITFMAKKDGDTVYVYPFSLRGCLFTVLCREKGRRRGFIDMYVDIDENDINKDLVRTISEEFITRICNVLDAELRTM